MQSMEGHVEFMFARVPVTYENVFEYASVNSDLKLPQFAVDVHLEVRLGGDEERHARQLQGLVGTTRHLHEVRSYVLGNHHDA